MTYRPKDHLRHRPAPDTDPALWQESWLTSWYDPTESFGTWRFGGRIGGGHLAVRERSSPSPEQRAWLTAHDPGAS